MTQARRADGAYLAKHAPADAHPDPRAVRKAIADELRRRRTSMAAGPRTLADVCKVAELAIGDVSPRLSGSRLLPWSMVEALARGLGVPVSTISSTIPATYKKST